MNNELDATYQMICWRSVNNELETTYQKIICRSIVNNELEANY